MFTVIFYSVYTNKILFEETFLNYYRAYSYAQNHVARGNYYEIVED